MAAAVEEDKYDDPIERRNLRYEYRRLIADTEQQKEDLVQPGSSGLNDALDRVNELFPKVRRTREAALDSQFLVLVSSLGHQRAQQFQTGMVTFETQAFVEKLLTFMDGRVIESNNEEEEVEETRDLENLQWEKLGKMAKNSFRRTPTIQFMFGPLSMDAPVKKVRQPKKTKEKPGSAAKTTPQQLLKVENNNEEATTREVQRVLEALHRVTDQGGEEVTPVYLFDFVTNPSSFSQSVENIFHLSFLINKGSACIELDEQGLPVVYPSDPYTGTDTDYDEVVKRKQVVIPFDMSDWKHVINIYKIRKPMIPTREQHQSVADEVMEED